MSEKRIYQLFVSSTYKDLVEERQSVMEAIVSSGNLPIGMENFPAGNESQFEYIKKLIDNCDYYLVILAGKYGSCNKKTHLSYTEMEYDYAVEKGVPIAALLYKDLGKLEGYKLESSNKSKKALEAFRKKCLDEKMCAYWENKDQLRERTKDAINNLIDNSPRPGWVRYSENTSSNQSSKAPLDLSLTEVIHLPESVFETVIEQKQAVSWKDLLLIVAPVLQKNAATGQIDDALRKELGPISDDDCDSIRLKLVSYGLSSSVPHTDDYSGPYTSMALTDVGYSAWAQAKQLESQGVFYDQDTHSLIKLFNCVSTDVLDDYMREGPDYVNGDFLTVSYNWGLQTSASGFSIHDQKLYTLIKDFSLSIIEISSHGECYDLIPGGKYKFDTQRHGKVHAQLLTLWDRMRKQYYSLITYIKQRYPKVNFSETNAEYTKDFG